MPVPQDPTQSAASGPVSEAILLPDSKLTKSETNPYATTSCNTTASFPSQTNVPHERYTLGDEIARGGMGAIYRATDTILGREVAVKMLLDKYGPDSGTARRFADEARIAAQLQHPGIPPVHDLGVLPDGRTFLAMKLIKGETLDELLRFRVNPSIDRGRFIAAFEHVCHAVAYAHAHGVIHRDLKPANVMVGSFGEVQVMDWGLAKVLGSRTNQEENPDETAAGTVVQTLRDSDGSFTQAGSVLGTPAYMPPEQAVGAIGKVDARSDVFGLGAILAVILTGKPPFEGNSAETTRVMAAQGDVSECFARLDKIGAEPDLVSLCKRCLSPKPADRPANAGEVAQAVATLRAAADERARQAELDRVKVEGEKAASEVRAVEQMKRRRMQLAFAVVAVAFLLSVTGVIWWRLSTEQLALERHRRNEDAVSALLIQCKEALQKNDSDKASIALEAADSRAAEGESESIRARREQLRGDLALIRELDISDTLCWSAVDNKLPSEDEDASRFLAILIRHGINPDESRRDVVLRTISETCVRERIFSVCDFVLRIQRLPELRSLLKEVDKDPFRDSARDALMSRNEDAIKKLVADPSAESQPPRFLVQLGRYPNVTLARRRELLTSALSQNPSDLWLLMSMSQTFPFDQREGAAEKIRWLQAALTVTPKNTGILNLLGVTLYKLGDVDGAISAHSAATRLDSKSLDNLVNLARALNKKGNSQQALDLLQNAIKLNPNSVVTWIILGAVLDDRKDFDGAIAAYQQAIKLDPKYVKSYFNMGISLKAKGEIDGAIAAYREAIKLDPKYVIAHLFLGNELKAKGDLDGAIAAYQQAIQLDPKDPDIHSNLGMVLDDRKDFDGAIAAYREAIKLDPNYVNAYSNMGISLKAKGDLDGAIAAYQQAIKLDPKFALPHFNLGGALKVKGDVEGAIAAYQQAIKLDPKYVFAYFNLCGALKAKGDFEGAIAAYREAIKLDPKDPDTHSNLGNMMKLKGDVDGASDSFREAIKLDPKDPDSHTNLGLLLVERKDFGGAFAAYREAIKQDPKFFKAYIFLGNALVAKGDLDGAFTAHKDALRIDPNQVSILSNMKRIERIRELLPMLPDILSGKAEPKTPAEACEFASICGKAFVKQYVAAAKLYEKALAADPKLAELNVITQSHRYNAACNAARAGRGEGIDAPSDEITRTSFRNKAHVWLRADLAIIKNQAASSSKNERSSAVVKLEQWLFDSDLSELREAKSLSKLSDDERKQWQILWSDVKETLVEAWKPTKRDPLPQPRKKD